MHQINNCSEGCLVLARTKEYCSVFHGKIRDKKVKKSYLALAAAPLPVGVMIYCVSIWLQDFFRKGFRWAIDHDKWRSRVDNIKDVFEEAQVDLDFFLVSEAQFDLGKSVIDKKVVEKVWDRIAPGLASQFDSLYTIPIIAPRPLLILNEMFFSAL
ncbi:hypothetical protein RHGRI_017246 [Rhododendron griersonianum]|uniref:Pseudouridine synthase RsuA/RluA-like domain-containing protein n=1 Tax=Rhododendron griersonianum TaxID=479676 RepID=A0AAV6JX28_9ERIC|nr:hypothetical protein RHGRI_017246 [Rhododendron griersonianum]